MKFAIQSPLFTRSNSTRVVTRVYPSFDGSGPQTVVPCVFNHSPCSSFLMHNARDTCSRVTCSKLNLLWVTTRETSITPGPCVRPLRLPASMAMPC
jgi:hypothetical protein